MIQIKICSELAPVSLHKADLPAQFVARLSAILTSVNNSPACCTWFPASVYCTCSGPDPDHCFWIPLVCEFMETWPLNYYLTWISGCLCHGAWCRGRTQMQSSKAKLDLFNKRQEQKARLSRIPEILNCGKIKQNKTWLWLWKIKAKTWPDKTWTNVNLRHGVRWGFLHCSEGNLETKYCGEVIGDGVQLWNKDWWLEWT